MSDLLAGQTALVTGASRGIGRAIAAALAGAGAAVIGTATSEKGAAGIEQELPGAVGCVLDAAQPQSVAALGELLEARGLSPSILVNNAGITRDGLLMRMKDEDWDAVLNTDLGSVYRLTKLCLRGMMKARAGRIVNVSSVVAFSGNAGQSNYAAAKAGIIGFTKSLAREVGSRGITVNAVAPGFIATDMTASLSESQNEQLRSQIALGRLGTVDDIAGVVVFLASPSAAYITGETIHVNGGMYMA
jgi:3-oxoacyl-[acyl-carrier protein] reductase